MAFDLDSLIRDNIKTLVPYSSARGEYDGDARIFLDANENAFGSPTAQDFSRYPDPLQAEIKQRIARIVSVAPDQIFLGNGSDEAIDLLFRIFCRPGIDRVIVCPPTYGMFEVSANINAVTIDRVNLTEDFDLDVPGIKDAFSDNTKMLFLCSPNNPTGNVMKRDAILELLRSFGAIVVVDEAYVHFSERGSLIGELERFPNLVVLQTYSKAWGLAGLRVGTAFASKEIIALFNKVKPPYNVSHIAQQHILEALNNRETMCNNADKIIVEREKLMDSLKEYRTVKKVLSSDANFLLVRVENALSIYEFLLNEGIVVRDQSRVAMCEGCLRITVGTSEENRSLLLALEKYEKSFVH